MKNSEEKLNKLLLFSAVMREVRAEFPEHAREIDRCIFDVGHNNIPDCGDPKCYCKRTFEEFHADQNAAQGRSRSYELN